MEESWEGGKGKEEGNEGREAGGKKRRKDGRKDSQNRLGHFDPITTGGSSS